MAQQLDPEKSKSLIQEFRNQNKAAGDHAWKTPEGHHLNGFFIDRESLESLLKDEKVAGIHVSFAKHPDFEGKPDNVHTIAVSGSIPNTQPGAATPFTSTAQCLCNYPPCPPLCSSSAS
jgi:hypothetical protein